MRGFMFPGPAGAVNAAVAQHDWLHVLGDYGTTPLGEIEVLSFQTAATRTPGAMLGLVGALALFESGAMPASLIVHDQPTHALSAPGAVDRMAEAVARGAACGTDLLLDVDFFRHAGEPLEDVRARFGIPAKSQGVLRTGPGRSAEAPASTLELIPDPNSCVLRTTAGKVRIPATRCDGTDNTTGREERA